VLAIPVSNSKKAGDSAGFSVGSTRSGYLRFFRAAALAALFRARVRAPLRADALRAALLLLPPLFFAARLFAAAMLSLHDEVERSPVPWWNRRVLHRGLTGTRVTKERTSIST
jgi:hypothetical protein